MSQYYYFGASLPMIQPDGAPPMSANDFLADCERLLSPSDFEQVRQAKLSSPELAETKVGVLQRYQDAEFGLRNELVKVRAKKLGVETDRYVREESLNPLLVSAAREILEQEDPLRAEIHISRVLWRILDDLLVGHYFDVDFLAAYYLKLQILERNASFQTEAGERKLESILTGDKTGDKKDG
jgi:hypothetical protein